MSTNAKSSNLRRLDANESAFFKRQLEYIKTRTYDTKFKQLKAYQLIPISTEAPAGADTITFQKYTNVGFAKIIADYSQDLPRADVYGEEETIKVRTIGSSYGYNVKEIRRAQMAGTNLNDRRANSARRAVDSKINAIAFSGDSNYNISGLISYPGITEYTLPADGTGSSKLWSTKTPDQIVRDLSNLTMTPVDLTNGVEAPDTLILPIAKYNYIANTRMTDGDSKTILRFFLDNNPYIKKVEWVTELKGAGVGATDRMMVYPNDPNTLTLEIPLMFEQLPEQWKGLEAVVPCEAETAGILVYYPLAIAYADGF